MIKSKSAKLANTKNKKVNPFKSSLEKLFRIKSKSEKSLKNDYFKEAIIPQTIYLTPKKNIKLSRDREKIEQKHPASYSCSDIVCPQRSTFSVSGNVTTNQIATLDIIDKVVPSVFSYVSHSKSIPTQLSKSHQNITKSSKKPDHDSICPAKRIVRKRGLFNCSLFRKRSGEKLIDQSTCLVNDSSLSDRCLTLPNLKVSEIALNRPLDVTSNRLMSMDLIKDYLNRSSSSLQLSVHDQLMDSQPINPPQWFPSSEQHSPPTLYRCSCDKKLEMVISQSGDEGNRYPIKCFHSQKSASNDLSHAICCSATSSVHSPNNAFNSTFYQLCETDTKQKPPFLKQISAPVNCQTSQITQPYLSSAPPNSAFDFWTQPYQEKLKASRRRLLDDKVGCKEALLRSLSPHTIKASDAAITSHQLHAIPEPCDSLPQGHSKLTHSKSFQSYGQCRAVHQICVSGLITTEAECQKETDKPPVTANAISLSQNERTGIRSDLILPLRRNRFEGSLPEIKDNKSINSSNELILTRTPTPPHSFAESPVSSIYPVPSEFNSDITKSQTNVYSLCVSNHCIDHLPPVPPPRTDSVLRSLQLADNTDQSELEYDISDEFQLAFCGRNTEHCDIQKYDLWLGKLPYKMSEYGKLLTDTTLNEDVENVAKEFKECRKEIKSWNESEEIRPTDNAPVKSTEVDTNFMKRSHSYDRGIDNFAGSPGLVNAPIAAYEGTLLKQYSHLYSLKPSPSQENVLQKINPLVRKVNRSKSIDLRNIGIHMPMARLPAERGSIGSVRNRKSVPNAKFNYENAVDEISG